MRARSCRRRGFWSHCERLGYLFWRWKGNHERAHWEEQFSWIDYLSEEGLVTLLNPFYEGERIVLQPFEKGVGAYIDLPCGARVLGVRYAGAATSRVVRDLAQAMVDLPGPHPAYTILMLHAGLQGILDNYSATLARTELDPLRPLVDYLALGHIHKPFVQDDWIYNPGSLETNSTTEVEWEDRGYFWVEVDSRATAIPPGHQGMQSSPRFRKASVSGRSLRDSGPTVHGARSLSASRGDTRARKAPLRGGDASHRARSVFDSADLDTQTVEKMVMDAFHPVVCQIKNTTAPTAFEIVTDGRSREEIERGVIRELLERDVRRRASSSEWADLVLGVKQMALDGDTPAQIVATLRAFRQTVLGEGPGC